MGLCGGKPGKNQAFQRVSEEGSVIIWILIAVVLFAALSFAFSQNTRSGGQSIDEEKVKLVASEIMDYARVVRSTVQTLRINGCSDLEISFDQSFVAGYNNASAPSDNSCHVFDGNGGGAIWQKVTPEAGGAYGFSGSEIVPSVGTGASELVFKWQGLQQSLCSKLNENLGVTNTVNDPPETNAATCDLGVGACKFTGAYPASDTVDNGASEFDGVMAACYNENNAGTNFVFYQVLIAR